MTEAASKDRVGGNFIVDPLIEAIYKEDHDYFNLVLMAPWPRIEEPDPAPFDTFMTKVRGCFDDQDLRGPEPRVYLYPNKFLHVTIATYCTNHKRKSDRNYEQMKKEFCILVHGAAKCSGWPTQKLRLEYDSVKLAPKAGILLWREVTGGLDAMRRAIHDEALRKAISLHHIPNIVHTTFLRYYRQPTTAFETVQFRFKDLVAPHTGELFESGIQLDTIEVISESMPYNVTQEDDIHLKLSLGTN